MRIRYWVVCLVSALCCHGVLSNEVSTPRILESRYVTALAAPDPTQRALMQALITTEFPATVVSVGDALRYLLEPSGYRLNLVAQQVDQYVLFTRPLPDPHRRLGPMTLQTALETLGSPSFALVINPVLRQVHFQVKDTHRAYVSDTDIAQAKQEWETAEQTRIAAAEAAAIAERREADSAVHHVSVRHGETLSAIAATLDWPSLTPAQVLSYLFQHNPQAFVGGNMNHLRVDAQLSIPQSAPSEVLSIQDARALVEHHYQRWTAQVQQP